MTSITANGHKLARRLAATALLTTALALGTNPAMASAEQVWDVMATQDCEEAFAWQQTDMSINEQKKINEACCVLHGGVFKDDGYLGKCVAPPHPDNQKPRLPGNIRIPPNISTEPVVTQQPSAPDGAVG